MSNWNSQYLQGNLIYAAVALVHFKMKLSPWFTHHQIILGVYDFILSDEYNLSYVNKHPDASELYNGIGLQALDWSSKMCIHPS